MMTPVIVTVVVLFTAAYIMVAAAVIYHLKKYALPEDETPRFVTRAFLIVSALLWIAGIALSAQIAFL